MIFRRVLTASLLLFVAVSVVILIGKEFAIAPVSGGPSPWVQTVSRPKGGEVVAYYFVGKVRCSSCRTIEDVSRKTIGESFPRELAEGRLRFLVVNVDRPENRHFVGEFRLASSALVLAKVTDGQPVEWKNLSDVWALAENEPRLESYIRDEVAARLKGI